MLAKSVPAIPEGANLSFEPKWDGFRVLAAFDGTDVELVSRGAKSLTRYFPELVAALRRLLPGPCIIDGEIVVPVGGAQRLDWEALSQRIHPAASRVEQLAEQTPASLVAFDLLRLGDHELLAEPFRTRRSELVSLVARMRPPIHVTRATSDPATARRWFAEFEGAGLDGVVAKSLDAPYSPGKRTMMKIKHTRTADVVAVGYRIHKSGRGLGSLLVGLYDADGQMRNVGGVSAFSNERRLELITELAPYVERDVAGNPTSGETERSRFTGSKDVSFVPLRPERVLEVRYDQLEGARFRHTVQFDRWRPDRDPRSCTFSQLEQVAAYDLRSVLG
nr:ATP-dependent DNA ligase [Microbacterium endophyticum]